MAFQVSGTGGGYAGGDILRLNVFTISAWLYGSNGNPLSNGFVAGRQATTASGSMQYALATPGGLQCIVANHELSQNWGTAFQSWGGSAGAWYHVYGWHDGSTIFASLKQLGGSQGTASASHGTAALDVSGEFTIGDNGGNSWTYSPGAIAEVAVWNVVLNANELASLDAKIPPTKIRPQSLVGYWPCYGRTSESNQATSSSREGTAMNQRFGGAVVDIGRHAPVGR